MSKVALSSIFKYSTIVLLFGLLFLQCTEESSKNILLFEKVEPSYSGVEFINKIQSTTELNILNYLYFYNGSGVATGDFNNDGLVDIYFGANQTEDKLYINTGDLTFRDASVESFIANSSGWTTGVTTVDINNDGLLDIYVSKIGSYKSLKGHNLLFVNQGANKDGIPVFREESNSYGLDFSTFATQAVFFDYDLDGDLDLYTLNHSTHPNRTYGHGSTRNTIDEMAGDRLYNNKDGEYIDVTAIAGIFQGNIGYGLGIAVGDLNNDGFPDIYIGNDFFENDYLYINQQNGTFSEQISKKTSSLGHTTHFSMGNAIADINNDGFDDIVSVDMLPEDLKTYKTSALEFNFQIYHNYLQNGYAPQFMHNTMHINRGNQFFTQVAYLNGLAATEWSWSPLLCDFDLDGYSDIYITNGIKGATNDMDFINFIANDNIQSKIEDGLEEKDLKFIQKLPEKKTANYFYKNVEGHVFKDMKGLWYDHEPSFSNGCAYADFDNDGDLDLVVNNVNEKALILKNNSIEKDETLKFLKVKFEGSPYNINGIGCKVIVYSNDEFQTKENFPVRGYLSSVESSLHFGLGLKPVDSVVVVWPDKRHQVLHGILPGSSITLKHSSSVDGNFETKLTKSSFLSNTDLSIDFSHQENYSIEFNREPLIPYASTNEGPDISVTDFNQDGRDDIFISGAKGQPSQLLFQDDTGAFHSVQKELFQTHSLNEDISHATGDINNDGFVDLIVASGGNEFTHGNAIRPRIYYNRNGLFELDTLQFENLFINASKIGLHDLNGDNYLDVLITSDADPTEYGKSPRQYLFLNDGLGFFEDFTKDLAPELELVGNVKDFEFTDINGDGFKDIVLAGHYMAITVFLYIDGIYVNKPYNGLDFTQGWWNCITVVDFDNDGDLDILAGNWGLNSRLRASRDNPVTLYNYDFDDNGSLEPLLTYYYKNVETPFASKEELAKQLPSINKKYLSYKNFANATLDEIFGKTNLKNSHKKHVYELASCYFENLGSKGFKKHILPYYAQVSSVNDILASDLNNDGFFDVLLTGNNYEISTQLSRLDGSQGEILINDKHGGFDEISLKNFSVPGASRTVKEIVINDIKYVIIGRNNDSPLFLRQN